MFAVSWDDGIAVDAVFVTGPSPAGLGRVLTSVFNAGSCFTGGRANEASGFFGSPATCADPEAAAGALSRDAADIGVDTGWLTALLAIAFPVLLFLAMYPQFPINLPTSPSAADLTFLLVQICQNCSNGSVTGLWKPFLREVKKGCMLPSCRFLLQLELA